MNIINAGTVNAVAAHFLPATFLRIFFNFTPIFGFVESR
jgi:hypothetical protein